MALDQFIYYVRGLNAHRRTHCMLMRSCVDVVCLSQSYLIIFAYFVAMGLATATPPAGIWENVKTVRAGSLAGCWAVVLSQPCLQNMWPMVKTGWVWWIPCQLVNFNFVPVKYQGGAVFLINYGWVIILSIKYVAAMKAMKAKQALEHNAPEELP